MCNPSPPLDVNSNFTLQNQSLGAVRASSRGSASRTTLDGYARTSRWPAHTHIGTYILVVIGMYEALHQSTAMYSEYTGVGTRYINAVAQ